MLFILAFTFDFYLSIYLSMVLLFWCWGWTSMVLWSNEWHKKMGECNKSQAKEEEGRCAGLEE